MGYLYVVALLATGLLAIGLTRVRAPGWGPATFSQVSAVTLTPLSVLFAFLAGFLAVQVWTGWDRAAGHVAQEASAVREAVLLADAGDRALGLGLRADLSPYLVQTGAEWRAMAEGRTAAAGGAPYVAALHRAAVYAGPAPAEPILKALEAASDARWRRLMQNESGVLGHGRWAVLVALAFCLQLSIALVHAHHRAAQGVTVAIFTGAAAVALLTVAAFDTPYRAWPAAVGPGPLQEARAALF